LFSTSTTAQGVVPGSNGAAATSFLNATGAWSVPAGGAGLPLIGTGATVTTSQPLLDLSQTWNASAVPFEGVRLNITGSVPATAAAGSKLFDVQVGGTSALYIGPDGNTVINQVNGNYVGIMFQVQLTGTNYFAVNSGGFTIGNPTGGGGVAQIGQTGVNAYINFAGYGHIANDTDIVNNIALHNGATGQAFRVYNTRDGTNIGNPANYERGVFDWTTTGNTLTIGTQNAGTGVMRPIHFVNGSPGTYFYFTSGGSDVVFIDGSQLGLRNQPINWTSGGGVAGLVSQDTGLSRVAAKVLSVTDGSTNAAGWHQWAGEARATANTSITSSTTLVPVTGLTTNVQAGRTYGFQAELSGTWAAAGGVRAAIAGTATATNIVYDGWIVDSAANGIKGNAQSAALAGVVANAATTGTAGHVTISGAITVNAAGTLLVQAAQSVSNAGATAILQGSTFFVWDMP